MVKHERNRYILFTLLNERYHRYNKRDLITVIWKVIWKYYGLRAVNKMGLWIITLNTDKNYGIIKFSHNNKELIISALSLVQEIKEKRVIITPIKTSGTIKRIKNKINEILN